MTIDRELITKMLRAAFPDPAVQIGVEAVDGAIGAMERAWRPEFEHYFGIPSPTERPTDPSQGADDAQVLGYYLAHAKHSRVSGPAQHSFEGFLPMVHITLPADSIDIQTRMGWCYAGDRLLHSMLEARTYAREIGNAFGVAPQLEKVELLTPPRMAGARFGAIAVYVFHPWGAVVEAGMATGQPRVLYWLPKMGEWVTRRSWYEPTPDSSPKHFYRARLSVDEARRPSRLEIHRFNSDPELVSVEPVMAIDVRFERHVQPLLEYPGELLFQAACRVAAVQHAMGKELPDVGFITPVLAELAKLYPWSKEPS